MFSYDQLYQSFCPKLAEYLKSYDWEKGKRKQRAKARQSADISKSVQRTENIPIKVIKENESIKTVKNNDYGCQFGFYYDIST